MNVAAVVREILGALPASELAGLGRIEVRLRRRPNRRDRARGCIPAQKACFYGVPADREIGGDAPTLPGTEGSAALAPTSPSRAYGEIVLFTANLKPLTRQRLETAIRHELAHARGHDETGVTFELGHELPEDSAC